MRSGDSIENCSGDSGIEREEKGGEGRRGRRREEKGGEGGEGRIRG
jgi:hypothetical protein